MAMTRRASKAPYLAALLSRYQDDVATTWAEMAQNLPGSRYADQSIVEVRACLSRAVTAAIEPLSTGSYEAMEARLEDIALARTQMDFHISENTRR